jgi:hypothetical protein
VFGRYGATKNRIEVTVRLLKNNRISLQITDTKTDRNIDDSLASNTQRNQFIGTLPIEKPNYVIEYVNSSDSFSVNVFDGSEYDAAVAELKNGIGVDSIDPVEDDEIFIYGSGNTVNNDF